MIRQFVDSSTASGNVAIAGSGVDFDSIVGAHAPDPAPHVAHVPAPVPVARRRVGGRRSALVAMAALGVSGIVIAGGLVAAADLMTHVPTAPKTVLASESGAQAEVAAASTTAFGSAAGLGDGLAVTVSDPIAFSPSPVATGAGGGVDVVSTVTVTNTTVGAVNARLSLTPLGTTATRILDRAQGIRANSVTTLNPGQSFTYRIAYAVGDVAKLSLQVDGADGESLVYGP